MGTDTTSLAEAREPTNVPAYNQWKLISVNSAAPWVGRTKLSMSRRNAKSGRSLHRSASHGFAPAARSE